MKKITLSRLTLLVSTGILFFALSSCSTSQMALNLHRNHIILVKAPPTNTVDPQKAIASTATASTDASLLALPERNELIGANSASDFQIDKKAPEVPVDNLTSASTVSKPASTQTSQSPLLSYDAKTKAIIKTIQFVQKISGKKQTSAAPAPMTMNSHNYLILWIACLGGALLFYIIAVAAISPILWLLGGLLSIAALVFFILWILAMANG
jgi:hypothetical protein